jgi:hypothetical protein
VSASSDEAFVLEVLAALELTRLEALVRLPGDLSFESLRSRSIAIDLAGRIARVASLEDVIRSKEAAGRPKDYAQLPILRDTLRVKKALEKP